MKAHLDVVERLAQLHQSTDALRLYALVDGVQFRTWFGEPCTAREGFHSLFADTPDAALAHAGPWLVDTAQIDGALVHALAALKQAAPAVTWLIAPQTIEGLAQLLQLNLDTALPDGRTALVRFWDPRVLVTLAEVLEPGQRETFFGYIHEWHLLHVASAHGSGGDMLQLSESQWQALQARDTHQFVVSVCDQFVATRPDVLDRPGRATVLERMQGAHDAAARIGFTSTAHIVHLMYLAADAPGIHADPLVEAYIKKPGATPEQRLDDMLAVMNNKMGRTY